MNTSLRVTLLSALFTLPFSACSGPREGATVGEGGEQTSAPRAGAKADGEQAEAVDRCEEFSLYGDGVCDPQCALPDPDCTPSEPTPEEESRPELDEDDLNWLCGPEEGELNGLCLRVCGDRDPDCVAEREQPPEDPCSGGFDHSDGLCDERCFPEDDDCRLLNDACYEEYRYGDQQCDQDCAFSDPDCGWEQPISDILSWDEQQICSRFPSGPLRRELATSICIERSAADQPACIVACVRAGN